MVDKFLRLEVSPVIEGNDTGSYYCERLMAGDARQPTFWSVYGLHEDGTRWLAISDHLEEDMAVEVAAALSVRWNVPVVSAISKPEDSE